MFDFQEFKLESRRARCNANEKRARKGVNHAKRLLSRLRPTSQTAVVFYNRGLPWEVHPGGDVVTRKAFCVYLRRAAPELVVEFDIDVDGRSYLQVSGWYDPNPAR